MHSGIKTQLGHQLGLYNKPGVPVGLPSKWQPPQNSSLHFLSSLPCPGEFIPGPLTVETDPALGVVIVDHGSKRQLSNEMLFHVIDLYKRVTGRSNVQGAHMELAEPTISQAVAACVALGATRVIIAPYFLSKGRHIQDDIPALVRAAQEEYPQVECIMAEPLGIDPLLAQLIETRVATAAAAAGGNGDSVVNA